MTDKLEPSNTYAQHIISQEPYALSSPSPIGEDQLQISPTKNLALSPKGFQFGQGFHGRYKSMNLVPTKKLPPVRNPAILMLSLPGLTEPGIPAHKRITRRLISIPKLSKDQGSISNNLTSRGEQTQINDLTPSKRGLKAIKYSRIKKLREEKNSPQFIIMNTERYLKESRSESPSNKNSSKPAISFTKKTFGAEQQKLLREDLKVISLKKKQKDSSRKESHRNLTPVSPASEREIIKTEKSSVDRLGGAKQVRSASLDIKFPIGLKEIGQNIHTENITVHKKHELSIVSEYNLLDKQRATEKHSKNKKVSKMNLNIKCFEDVKASLGEKGLKLPQLSLYSHQSHRLISNRARDNVEMLKDICKEVILSKNL